MNTHTRMLAIALVLLLHAPAGADEPRPLRAARSANGDFELRVRPGGTQHGTVRKATARLYSTAAGDRTVVWETELPHPTAPLDAAVAPDGKFVVLLDSHPVGGAEQALVVLDARGKVAKSFALRELLKQADWTHVRRAGQAVFWREGGQHEFVRGATQFQLRLRWGRVITVDLLKLELVEAATGGAPSDEVSAALENLRRMALQAGIDVEQPGGYSDEQILALIDPRVLEQSGLSAAELIAAIRAGYNPSNLQAALEQGLTLDQLLNVAGNSGLTGRPIPNPDPANPVDYLALANSWNKTPGPNAVPLIERVRETMVKFDGDFDLYDAAINGDPEALNSPEIAAFLEANAEAIATYRQAIALDYAGMPVDTGGEDNMIAILLPHCSEMRQMSKTMSILGQRHEASGEYAAAADLYIDIVRGGEQMSKGYTLIENLVGVAQQALGAARIQALIETAPAGTLDYAALSERLQREYKHTSHISKTFQGERAMILDIVQDLYAYDEKAGMYTVAPDGPQKLHGLFQLTGVEPEDEADADPASVIMSMVLGSIGFENMVSQTNEHYDRLTEAAYADYPNGRVLLEGLEREIENPRFRMRNPLLSMLLPSLSRARTLETGAFANRNATLAIAELHAYRARTGAFPTSLTELGNADYLTDPFSGQPLRYQLLEDGRFQLYSAGANGVDDGGVHQRGYREEGDHVYWPRPVED